MDRMNGKSPVTFYCRSCKMMLNEKCFLDVKTGELKSICSMCAMVKERLDRISRLTLGNERLFRKSALSDLQAKKHLKKQSFAYLQGKYGGAAFPSLQNFSLSTIPSDYNGIYVAKVVCYPYYCNSHVIPAPRKNISYFRDIPSQQCDFFRSPSNSSLEATGSFSLSGDPSIETSFDLHQSYNVFFVCLILIHVLCLSLLAN